MERTFAMIKPDAVAAGHTGEIIKAIETNDFTVVAMKKMLFTKELAEQFYAVHSHQPFFGELVDFISSGPAVALVLEKEGGINAWRELMGATDPAKATAGTIRERFGQDIGHNATHGSDAPETAKVESNLIFPEIV